MKWTRSTGLKVAPLMGAALGLISCASKEPVDPPPAVAESTTKGPSVLSDSGEGSNTEHEASSTGGLAFEMRIVGDDNYAVVYRVTEEALFEFAGGRDALSDRVTWSTQLTEADVAALNAVIETNRWYTHQPSGGETQPGAPVRTISVSGRGPGGGLHMYVRGLHDRVEPVRAFLESVANRRLARDLDSLPRAGDKMPE